MDLSQLKYPGEIAGIGAPTEEKKALLLQLYPPDCRAHYTDGAMAG